jgi:hypothetical protein
LTLDCRCARHPPIDFYRQARVSYMQLHERLGQEGIDNIRNARLAGYWLYVGGLTRARMFPRCASPQREPSRLRPQPTQWPDGVVHLSQFVNIDLHMLGVDVSLRSSRLSIIG